MIGKTVVAIVIVEAAARLLLSNELSAARHTIQTAHLLALLVQRRFEQASRAMHVILTAMAMAWRASRFAPSLNAWRRCRMLGGTNPNAPKGDRNAWKHGGRSAKALQAARYLRSIAKLVYER